METIKQPPKGHLFAKGNPGRRKGSKNKATVEIREIAQRIMCDPEYLDSLSKRIAAGKAPHMETLMAHYAWGKPHETVDLGDKTLDVIGKLAIEVVNSNAL